VDWFSRKDDPMSGDDLLTTGQVQQLLGVSRRTMARLIATDELHTQPDPLDRRIKLIRRSEVDALLARSSKLERAA
jgi:hypothetical protein